MVRSLAHLITEAEQFALGLNGNRAPLISCAQKVNLRRKHISDRRNILIVSQQRLTLFALISAIEEDTRHKISKAILPGKTLSEVFPSELLDEARKRMRKASHLVVDASDESELLEFMNLGDHFQTMNRWKQFLSPSTLKILSNNRKVEQLVAIRNRVMHGRPLDFDDLPFVKNICEELVSLDHLTWAVTRDLLKNLRRNPDFVFDFEDDFEFESKDAILNNLPSPDFDDTGFVGRQDQLTRLKSALKGSFPIITILGDGGLGKTSLALKALYDLLDEGSGQFDAIIWTTAKANILTADSIVEIEDSIKDSIGIFAAANTVLGHVDERDPMGAVREWLSAFRILLVIDNLETILDERIRRFASEIPSGSKILFTTRVGLGAYDFPIELHQLSEREGVDYFRRICEVYGLTDLGGRKRDFIVDTCGRLSFSPLAIKWFVQAIRAGGAPSALLADPKLVLRFCVANVVDGLSSIARDVLDALIITGRPQTLSSLHFVLSADLIVLSNALRELRAANLILITPSQHMGGDDFYLVKPLANFYIRNYFAPSLEKQKQLRFKQGQLSFAKDRLIARRKGKTNVYDPNHIFIREEHAGSDFVVADYLSSAMTELRRNKPQPAEDYLARAVNMSPNYFEVHRVEAFMAFVAENMLRAEAAYERAVALQGDYAPLRYFFGGFLIRIGEPERAVEQLEVALALDDEEPSIKIELGRAYIRAGNFESAEQQLRILLDASLSTKAKKLVIANWFQLFSHRLSVAIARLDLDSAFNSVKEMDHYLRELDINLLDQKHKNTLSRMPPNLRRFISEERGSARSQLAKDLVKSIEDLLQIKPDVSPISDDVRIPGARRLGRVKRVFADKRFGFIEDEAGHEWFFHRNEVKQTASFEELVGRRVIFDVGQNDQGPCAVKVDLEEKE